MIRPKMTGFFLEISEFGMLAARTNSFKAPFTINGLFESPLLEKAQMRDFVQQITHAGKKQYSACHCGFYPPHRFIHSSSLDDPMKARDDEQFFTRLLAEKFEVDVKSNNVVVVNSFDGSEFGTPPLPKDIFLCGAPTKEINQTQESLMDCLVYPDQLEIGTFSGLGGIMHYLSHEQINSSMLTIEFSSQGASMFIYKDGKIDDIRNIPFGIDSFVSALRQKLNIQDEKKAREILLSGDFSQEEIVPELLAPLLKELHSFKSFYELKASIPIAHLFFTLLPSGMSWLSGAISKELTIDILEIDYPKWLSHSKVSFAPGVDTSSLDHRWFNLFSLMTHYSSVPNLNAMPA